MCALVTGVQTCALPISRWHRAKFSSACPFRLNVIVVNIGRGRLRGQERIYSVNMCAGCKYPPELRNRASRAGLGSGPREAENPMRIEGDYAKDGYATIRRLVPPEIGRGSCRERVFQYV